MAIASGTSLGHYAIIGSLGAGAMGEVYRARDPKLDREVAIKILPETFAHDRERLNRFEREAKLLAAVKHPAIATIHGLEESNGTRFLVMELVDGETLAERIERGIPLDELLPIFIQIAEALEAAHDKGIVHRDLKPSNIKIQPDGSVKVLDFGLAKVYGGDEKHADSSQSPTLSKGTALGSILGTPAYMSPEQARGRSVDQRTDVWAFGCCLFAALAGESPFMEETVSDTVASVLRAQPDWERLPAECPALLQALLRQCLHKDAHNRLHHAADLRVALMSVSLDETSPATEPRQRSALPWVAGIVLATVAGVLVGSSLRPTPEAPAVTRFAIHTTRENPLSAAAFYQSIAISPDGRTLLYSTITRGPLSDIRGPLFARSFGETEPRSVANTEGAVQPFCSPDGERIGYAKDGAWWRQPLAGGRAAELAPHRGSRGVSWADDGWFYFHFGAEGIQQVRVEGGTPELVVRPDTARGEKTIRHPWALPGGKAILVTVGTSTIESYDEATIEAYVVETGERKVLVEGGTSARYAPTGHLVFARNGDILAAPFDADALELTGPAAVVTTGVLTSYAYGVGDFAFSDDGTLVFVPGKPEMHYTKVLWMDREGRREPFDSGPHNLQGVHFSPDGARLALWASDGSDDIWVYELARGTTLRLTSEWDNVGGTWTADGRRVVYRSLRPGATGLYIKNIDGTGLEEFLHDTENAGFNQDLSRDGFLVFGDRGDLWSLKLGAATEPESFLATKFGEGQPAFSPDGRWLAYTSNESGHAEVYVRSFPDPGPRYPISTDGGRQPRWARNGSELFFATGDEIHAVAIETEPTVRVSKSRRLFDVRGLRSFDVAPDGRFLVIHDDPSTKPTEIHVVLNWFEELKQKAGTN